MLRAVDDGGAAGGSVRGTFRTAPDIGTTNGVLQVLEPER
ncbi:hypothetical protein FBY31_1900 [Arthrobacter sp. SLBN-100]|nr:hypothetical protein FBY31_1900 [Arthrobacter sp. SLBN-100]